MVTRKPGMTNKQFKALQEKLNWSNAYTAQELGLSVNTVEKIRQGVRPVTATVAKLFRRLAEDE